MVRICDTDQWYVARTHKHTATHFTWPALHVAMNHQFPHHIGTATNAGIPQHRQVALNTINKTYNTFTHSDYSTQECIVHCILYSMHDIALCITMHVGKYVRYSTSQPSCHKVRFRHSCSVYSTHFALEIYICLIFQQQCDDIGMSTQSSLGQCRHLWCPKDSFMSDSLYQKVKNNECAIHTVQDTLLAKIGCNNDLLNHVGRHCTGQM